MITGKKMIDEENAAQEQRLVSGWRALVVTGLVAVAGFALFQKTDFTQLAAVPAKAAQGGEADDN